MSKVLAAAAAAAALLSAGVAAAQSNSPALDPGRTAPVSRHDAQACVPFDTYCVENQWQKRAWAEAMQACAKARYPELDLRIALQKLGEGDPDYRCAQEIAQIAMRPHGPWVHIDIDGHWTWMDAPPAPFGASPAATPADPPMDMSWALRPQGQAYDPATLARAYAALKKARETGHVYRVPPDPAPIEACPADGKAPASRDDRDRCEDARARAWSAYRTLAVACGRTPAKPEDAATPAPAAAPSPKAPLCCGRPFDGRLDLSGGSDLRPRS